jgi:leucyl-tRNA synthetase
MNLLTEREAAISPTAMREVLETLALMLAPLAPYLSQEIWEELGNQGPVFRQPWPAYNPELAREDEAEIVVQVNGKVRGRIAAPFGAAAQELERRALADEKVRAAIAGKTVVKVVAVPDKLLNIVAR